MSASVTEIRTRTRTTDVDFILSIPVIHLTNCVSVSAEAISVNQFRSMKPWNFSYAEIVAES